MLRPPRCICSPVFPHRLSTDNVLRDDNHRTLVPALAIHASMYGIADKYGIQGLKAISKQKLEAALESDAWIPDSGQMYPSNMMEELAAAVQTAWTSTPVSDNGIRALLLDYALKNKEMLLGMEGFKLVVQRTPGFACDLLAQVPSKRSAKSPAAPLKPTKKRNLHELLDPGPWI